MTAAHEPSPGRPGRDVRVLVVVSAADRIPLREGGSEPTGTYLSELIEPAGAMLEAGFELSFATPGGRIPTIDGTSCSLMYFAGSRKRRDAALAGYTRLLALGLARPDELEHLAHDTDRLAGFDALFVPGGHAPLVDLLHRDALTDDSLNTDFGALVQAFHDSGRTTGLICHAPAALAAAPYVDGRWIYHGYQDVRQCTALQGGGEGGRGRAVKARACPEPGVAVVRCTGAERRGVRCRLIRRGPRLQAFRSPIVAGKGRGIAAATAAATRLRGSWPTSMTRSSVGSSPAD